MAILELERITKTFPGVAALTDVSITFERGEVHGIVGENGAGKSTLMKILTGVVKKDSGTIRIDGENVDIRSPHDSQRQGLSIIFQELSLVGSLSVAENIFAGRLPRRGPVGVDWRKVRADAAALLERVGLPVSPTTKVERLSVAQKQLVEIAKALSFDSRVILMDEPSATLTTREMEKLVKIIRALTRDGVTVVYISHRLDEVFLLCDRVTVLRDGRVISTQPIAELDREHVIALMVGRTIDREYPKRSGRPGTEIVLEVSGLERKGAFADISFHLRQGEILGIAGLVGSGRTEIVRAIFGADRLTRGTVRVMGKQLSRLSPRTAIRNRIALLTEDRALQGLVVAASVSNNISLASLERIRAFGFLLRGRERQIARDLIKKIGIKTPGPEQIVVNLSGGNQQKTILAKWLNTEPEILILDEPTRGIDVGAKYEIYTMINQLADQGKSVLLISSELPEVVNLSDRLLVVHRGRITGELEGRDITPEAVMRSALL